MDTEAHTVLWKWSHPRTMQSSWPSSPGSHKSGCFSGGLTLDPSNTRPVLTVSQAFISLWPLNITQTTTGQSQSPHPQSHAFFPQHFTPWHQCVHTNSRTGFSLWFDKVTLFSHYSGLVLLDFSSALWTWLHDPRSHITTRSVLFCS